MEKRNEERSKHAVIKRRWLNTRGGKVIGGPEKIPRSTRNRRPIRFMDDSDSKVSSDESTEEEDWTCQDCLMMA